VIGVGDRMPFQVECETFEIRPSVEVTWAYFGAAEVFMLVVLIIPLATEALFEKLWPGMSSGHRTFSEGAFLLALPLWFLFPYLISRKVHWVISADGVELFRRGILNRRIPWSDVIGVDVLPYMTVIRHIDSPKSGESLCYLCRADRRKLKDLWCRIKPPNPRGQPKEIPLAHMFRFTLGCGLISLTCFAIFSFVGNVKIVRGFCWAIGALSVFYGVPLGLWAAFRYRSLRLLICVIPAAAALTGWIWQLSRRFYHS
jgi:hypothetical protein